MKTGLFFGSYNPIHNGHLTIAKHILNHTDLDEIWFVVSPQNPWKSEHEQPSSTVRLKMVELAISNEPKFKATNFEEELPKPSYTYDALRYLKAQNPKTEFVLLIGGDNYFAFDKWLNYDKILSEFEVWAYPRQGGNTNIDTKFKNIKLISAPLIDISSTEIRNKISNKQQVEHLLDKCVLNYIYLQKLYC